MNISDMRTNHITNPIGYDFSYLYFTWKVNEVHGKQTTKVQIRIWKDASLSAESLIYDTGEEGAERKWDMKLSIPLEPYTRYYWKVTVTTDIGEILISDAAYFETAKMQDPWSGKWIATKETREMPWIYKNIKVSKPVKRARIYGCGLGLYELYVDDNKVGDEYLMPGYHSYDLIQEYQTYDVTDAFQTEGSHQVSFLLGEGWYKGRFVFEGGFENLYGDQKKVIGELHLTYEDGTTEIIGTNDSWKAKTSNIMDNNIYDGEQQDWLAAERTLMVTELPDSTELLQERTSIPVIKTEKFQPVEVITPPKGETVLDFGEMITGWIEFYDNAAKGEQVTLQYGEHMQEGNFYRDNLRTAKAEFTYISDGEGRWMRPHFTFYGFRYVLIEGIQHLDRTAFSAYRVMSDCLLNGTLETSDSKVNQLIENAVRSQKCNFLDIPTDCPQRDERMGWTGDIGVFADTACLNAECAGFFRHFLTTLRREQLQMKGSIPFFAPYPKVEPKEGLNPFLMSNGVCTWGDAATILPWSIYEHYQDIQLLEEFYPMMYDWTMYEKSRALENEIPYLWQNDRQLGDWLAMDNGNLNNPIGATDPGLIASAYYYYSTTLTLRAAEVLFREKDRDMLQEDLKHIYAAFQKEYLHEDGTLKCPETQTAYAVVLAMGLTSKEQSIQAVARLRELLHENGNCLNTGFVGIAFLMQALSEHGANDLAYELLLQEQQPSWLYEVNHGAISIWERWNSLLDDGTISGTDMNSLNHYAYGSVVAWIYQYACGFQSCLKERQTLRIRPMPNPKIKFLQGSYGTPWGVYKLRWEYLNDEQMRVNVTVPYDGVALLSLPGQFEQHLTAGEYGFVIRV